MTGAITNYTHLAYLEEELDRELETMVIKSDRILPILDNVKLLWWQQYKLTKAVDKWLDGDIGEDGLIEAYNLFRYETGYTPREED